MSKLKGHTEIILTDVNTGEITKRESDNMFTNALSDIISIYIKTTTKSNTNSCILPLYTNGISGLYLFQNEITEDADNYLVPAPNVNPIIGYAGTGSNSTSTLLGSMNTTECEELDNGYKFVWDFLTSQANGIISCVSLTHKNIFSYGAYSLCTNNNSVETYCFSADLYVNHFFVNLTDDDVLQVIYCKGGATSEYIEYKVLLDNVLLKKEYPYLEEKTRKDITIDFGITPADNRHDYDFKLGDDGYIYGRLGSYFIRINATTLEQDSDYGIKTLPYACYNTCMEIIGDYVYYEVNNVSYRLCKVNVNDMSDYKTVDVTSDTYKSNRKIYKYNGTIHKSAYTYSSKNYIGYVIDTDMNVYKTYEEYSLLHYQKVSNKHMMLANALSNTKSIYITPIIPYLATINNLSTPVTKTSAQTMKVVYTVTEEES